MFYYDILVYLTVYNYFECVCLNYFWMTGI